MKINLDATFNTLTIIYILVRFSAEATPSWIWISDAAFIIVAVLSIIKQVLQYKKQS
ncbi:hypothetical protein BRE01_62430 [Brevibacillus reuszeri]|uniref:Uncharacterized protein n=1 Tax=Brevibacillus reuszeri TaxID=54915 RepID=A0ABQ0TXS6_9BACL|nr:hypothetical protein BRE01_62430 [Brevibacillus reuszeri]